MVLRPFIYIIHEDGCASFARLIAYTIALNILKTNARVRLPYDNQETIPFLFMHIVTLPFLMVYEISTIYQD